MDRVALDTDFLDDVRLANQLAAATFALRLDELLPQTQQLLEELARLVSDQAQRQDAPREAVPKKKGD